jgi:hypothetical protein
VDARRIIRRGRAPDAAVDGATAEDASRVDVRRVRGFLLAAALACLAAACGAAQRTPPSVTVASPLPPPPSVQAPTIAASPSSTDPSASHLYYTSASPDARFYFCRTDPLWHRIPHDELRGFDSASTLQTAFPGRTLHRRC